MNLQSTTKPGKRGLRLQQKYFAIAEKLKPSQGKPIKVQQMHRLNSNPKTLLKYGLIRKIQDGLSKHYIVDIQPDYRERIKQASVYSWSRKS